MAGAMNAQVGGPQRAWCFEPASHLGMQCRNLRIRSAGSAGGCPVCHLLQSKRCTAPRRRRPPARGATIGGVQAESPCRHFAPRRSFPGCGVRRQAGPRTLLCGAAAGHPLLCPGAQPCFCAAATALRCTQARMHARGLSMHAVNTPAQPLAFCSRLHTCNHSPGYGPFSSRALSHSCCVAATVLAALPRSTHAARVGLGCGLRAHLVQPLPSGCPAATLHA